MAHGQEVLYDLSSGAISVTPDPDVKGTPLFDVEYLGKDARQMHGQYRPLIESDMWPIELCRRQLLRSTFKLISAILSDNTISVSYFLVYDRNSGQSNDLE